MKQTAYIFNQKTSFIDNAEVFERLLKIREESPDTASVLVDILKDLHDIRQSIASKQTSVETKNGWKTERSVKFVYLFQDVAERQFFKIGISKNVRARSFGVGAKVDILAVGFGGDELEFQLHRKFDHKRVWHIGSREWFTLNKYEADFAKKCIEAGKILEAND
jgi:hypothetical protein